MDNPDNPKSLRHLPIPIETEKVGKHVLDAAFKVHTTLGPGLLESAYEACLAHELNVMGLEVITQVKLPVIYGEKEIKVGYRIDFMVNGCVIVELKAVENMQLIFKAQLLTYLKLSGIRLGYLLNFNVDPNDSVLY